MNRRSRKCQIPDRVRKKVLERDKGCIFCQMGYHLPPEEFTASSALQIMHFVPRSQGGLGIEENLAVGCVYHHMILDNGRDTRAEMLEIFEEHLKRRYKNWSRQQLIYNKWASLGRSAT